MHMAGTSSDSQPENSNQAPVFTMSVLNHSGPEMPMLPQSNRMAEVVSKCLTM